MKTLMPPRHRTDEIDRESRRSRMKFRLTCPNCGSSVITDSPRTLVWELCPSCLHYVWDLSDALMAEAVPAKKLKDRPALPFEQ